MNMVYPGCARMEYRFKWLNMRWDRYRNTGTLFMTPEPSEQAPILNQKDIEGI